MSRISPKFPDLEYLSVPARSIKAGAIGSAFFSFPFFWKLDTRETWVIWLAIVVGLSYGVASISGSIAAFYSELFDTRIRYTGLVFAREVSGAVIGGFTPLFATSHDNVPTSVPSPRELRVLWDGSSSSMLYVHPT